MAKIYIITYVCNPYDGNLDVETTVKKTKEDAINFIEHEVIEKVEDIDFVEDGCESTFRSNTAFCSNSTSLPEAYIIQWGDIYHWTTKEIDLDEIS